MAGIHDHKTDHKIHKLEKEILKKEQRIYKFGFWLFFVLTIASVLFSVWTISTIYTNFNDVTKMLDSSFDRTDLLLDISTSKINNCQAELEACRTQLDGIDDG